MVDKLVTLCRLSINSWSLNLMQPFESVMTYTGITIHFHLQRICSCLDQVNFQIHDGDRIFYQFCSLRAAEKAGILLGRFQHQIIVASSLRVDNCHTVLTRRIHHSYKEKQTHAVYTAWAPLFTQAEQWKLEITCVSVIAKIYPPPSPMCDKFKSTRKLLLDA